MRKPNIVFVFGDQWRAQAFGYAGDPNAKTPRVDAFAEEAVSFANAVSGCPVCCAYRASLMTGQSVLTHGVFLNDVKPRLSGPLFAQALANGGYDAAYFGKWHWAGGPRLEATPPETRAGFRVWRGVECCHDYNGSVYYDENGACRRWEGYDAEAQTREAISFLRGGRERGKPFALFLSWAPPHDPYGTAPAEYRALFDPASLLLRPNVPEELAAKTRTDLAGYYAHCAALDACFGALLDRLDEEGLAEDTVVVFTSDHGDMLGSQGRFNKQLPWDESVRVPFLLRWPGGSCLKAVRKELIDAPDLMPSLLSLCGLEIPGSVEGRDLSPAFRGGTPSRDASAALLANVYPFHQLFGKEKGEWRAVRTETHTFARSHEGPWLLYDNVEDPFQLDNLAGKPEAAKLQAELSGLLASLLAERKDEFLPGVEYVKRFGHPLNAKGDVPYFHWEKDRLAYFNKEEKPA